MTRTRGPHSWKFPLFLEDPSAGAPALPGEVSGGESRMRGVQVAHQSLLARGGRERLLILVTGGIERDGSSRSDEAARQLVVRYNVPRDMITSIRGEGSTLGNSEATVEYLQRHPDIRAQIDSIEILTNDYHMLRAWLIFSRDMLMLTAEQKLNVGHHDIAHVERLLANGLPGDEGWTQAEVKYARERVMEVVQPYLSRSSIKVLPFVVEEALEKSPFKAPAARRYAGRLRNNKWVRQSLHLEYARVMQLLRGEI
jgi:hypothetical protein